MEISLERLRIGQRGIVTCMDVGAAMQNRLQAYGLVPGTGVCCRYRTPDGSVTALELRGTVIALRRHDMRRIRVRC